MPFPHFIRPSWLVVLLATWPGTVRSQEQAVRLETVTVVADRLPMGAADEPFSGTVAKKDRTFNAVLQLLLLRRTPVGDWVSAWRLEGAFGPAAAGLWWLSGL